MVAVAVVVVVVAAATVATSGKPPSTRKSASPRRAASLADVPQHGVLACARSDVERGDVDEVEKRKQAVRHVAGQCRKRAHFLRVTQPSEEISMSRARVARAERCVCV
jgi:hypothetical protein